MQYFFLILSIAMAYAQTDCITAKGTSNEGLSYSEHRCRTINQGVRQLDSVTYQLDKAPNITEIWATKTVNYKESPYLPEVHLKMPKLNYELKTNPTGPNEISIQLKSAGKNIDESLKVPAPAVLDAGIDLFIKDNINSLYAGKTLEFNLVVPEFGDWFRFEIIPSEINTEQINLEMKPASFFLSWFADPIQMTYSSKGQLVFYSGISDIKGPDGKNIKLDLTFDAKP